jgi:predicted permease
VNRSRLTPVFRLNGVARMKPGVTMEQANADVARMLEIFFDTFGANRDRKEQWVPSLRLLKDDVVGDVGNTLWIIMGTIGIVLLMACANVANLLIVRAHARQHEFAIRAALGARWTRLARGLLVESLMLAVLGGLLGVGFAYASLRVLVAMGPATLPRLSEISIDYVSVGFSVAISLCSAVVFGLILILEYARSTITTTLVPHGRSFTLTRDGRRAHNVLVALQMALALILLVSSGLMIRSVQTLRNVPTGFVNPHDVQSFTISIPRTEVQEAELATRMQHEIVEKMAAIPGVTSAAFTTRLPMDSTDRNSSAIVAEDRPESRPNPPNRHVRFVSPGFFQTLGTPLVTGRDFTWADLYENREVTIISENLAREFWGSSTAALGKRIREFYDKSAPWREVVGVAANVYDDGAHQAPPATVYWPAQVSGRSFGVTGYQPRRVAVAVRSERAGSESLLNEIRQAVRSVQANLPLAQVRTVGEIYDQSMVRTSFVLVMLASAGTMALLLGLLGIYGVISYAVSQRRREIGIRLALGAQAGEIRWLFVRRGFVLLSIGVALGVAGAFASTRLMESLLFGISPLDPITFMAMPVALAATAMLAIYVSTRPALAVDPVEALRSE